MADEKAASRRSYSAQLKAQVLAECAAPGASVAKVAMSHGINADVVHCWRRLAREGAGAAPVRVGEVVPVALGAPPRQDCAEIRIELRRGATTLTISWPSAAASGCAVWMRELLR